MRNKKSSLSLSVNAIVILIIAITMLGLALGFIRMMFGSATDKFSGLLEDEQDPVSPSASNPITLSRGMVTTNPGEDITLKIALYNPTNVDWNAVTPAITCSPDNFSSTVNTKKIGARKFVIFGALIDIPAAQAEGTSLCEVKFNEATLGILDYSTDFTVRIQYG